MRVPKIQNVQIAVETYYTNLTLGTKEIRAIFGGICNDKVSQLKRAAREQMEKDGIPSYSAYDVSSIAAFKAWGLDIEELTRRYRSMQKLGIGRGA